MTQKKQEKNIGKEELVKMIRGMVKENLQKRKGQKPLAESKTSEKKNVKKISVKELHEMVQESIKEILSEQTSKKTK